MSKGLAFFVSFLIILSAIVSFFTYQNLAYDDFIDSPYRTYYFIVYENYHSYIDSSLPNIVSSPVYYRGQYYKLRDYFIYDDNGNPVEFRIQFMPCTVDGVYLSDSPYFIAYTQDFEWSEAEYNGYILYDIDAKNLRVDYNLTFVINRIRTAINDYNYDRQNFGEILDGEGGLIEYATLRVKATFDLLNNILNIIANGGVLEF